MADSIEKKLASLRAEIESVSTEAMGYRTCDPNRAYAVKENMLCILDSISRALSPAGGLERGCDWYEDEDTGSRIVDFDFVSDHSRQLSLILKANGEVAYAAYINGTRMNGADAMTPEFYSAIRMLAASPQQEPGAGPMMCECGEPERGGHAVWCPMGGKRL